MINYYDRGVHGSAREVVRKVDLRLSSVPVTERNSSDFAATGSAGGFWVFGRNDNLEPKDPL